MDVRRAKQIMISSQEIYVTFEGDSVWIDNVDDSQNLVLVHSLETGQVARVPAARLHEE